MAMALVALAAVPAMRITRRAAVGALCGGSQLLAPRRSWAVPPAPLCDEDVSRLTTGNTQIVLVGTAHVSDESATLVRQVIQQDAPYERASCLTSVVAA